MLSNVYVFSHFISQSPITIDERLRAYRRQGVITESGVSQYRFRLCVAFQTLQTSSLRLDPAGVALGKKSVESLKGIIIGLFM